MRFVVDLYRYILLALAGITIICLLLLTFAVVDPNRPFQGEYATPVIFGALIMALLLVLSVGGIAIMISIHDRHAEIADRIGELVDALRKNTQKSDETP